jgi:hypothetical protein
MGNQIGVGQDLSSLAVQRHVTGREAQHKRRGNFNGGMRTEKLRGRDADNRERFAIQPNNLADHAGIASREE